MKLTVANLDTYRALEQLGTALTPEMVQGTLAAYADLVEEPTPELCTVARDLSYGPDPRHRLDIFTPVEQSAAAASVLLFVHGGGFVRGDKGGPEDPFYNNVGAWATQRGLVGVTMTYRLAPDAQWPAGSADVALALEWLAEHVGRFGGDPGQIFVMGQSAGAVHVAGYLAGHHGSAGGTRVAGAIMVSGLYDLTSFEHSPFEDAYFGTDPARFAAQSSLEGLLRTSVPCLYAVAELDSPFFQRQAAELVQAHLAARGRWPRMLYLPLHNHISTVVQLGAPGDTLGRDLHTFILHRAAG